LVTKLLIVPTAIVGVLFPAFSASFAQNSIRAGAMLRASVKYTCLVLFPIVLVVIAFAPEGLRLWLGTEFAERSSRALQWLAVGVFLNALALIPFAAVQGAGRPDWTGKLHLLELPFYLVMVWCLIGKFGIEGAAMAWTARVAVDTAVLFAMAQRIMPAGSVRLKQMAGAAIAFLAVLGAAFLMADVRFKAGFLFFSLAGSSLLGWFAVLDPAERLLVRGGLRKSSTAV